MLAIVDESIPPDREIPILTSDLSLNLTDFSKISEISPLIFFLLNFFFLNLYQLIFFNLKFCALKST